ncbi:MAG: hypothetical protein Q9160_002749 [Pyrenula sp. 1 TL-2023]
MFSSASGYRLLERESFDSENEKSLGYTVAVKSTPASKIVLAALFASFCANIILLVAFFNTGRSDSEDLSEYARLEKNINIPFTRDTIYSSPNHTLQDQAWADDWDQIDLGVVAIPDSDARSMDLPETQKWPWDHSKGIYILNGFHDLHCIHLLHRSARTAFAGEQQTIPEGHVLHCLESLRDDVICKADDMPRYTGRRNAQADVMDPFSGVGQKRMCRDWDQLTKWAIERTACYGRAGNNAETPLLDLFTQCPDGTVPGQGRG